MEICNCAAPEPAVKHAKTAIASTEGTDTFFSTVLDAGTVPWLLEASREDSHSWTLGIGSGGAGAPFHAHNSALNLLVGGAALRARFAATCHQVCGDAVVPVVRSFKARS